MSSRKIFKPFIFDNEVQFAIVLHKVVKLDFLSYLMIES